MADWDLMILIIQSSRPVIVVLNHTTDGNRQPQIRKYLFRHMHLTFSTIHQDQVRKLAETAEFVFLLVFLFSIPLRNRRVSTSCMLA